MAGRIGNALVIVLLLSLPLAGTVFAQGDGPEGGRGLGQVVSLGPSSFTVQARSGAEHTLLVDEETTFEDRNGDPLSFDDVEVGDWLAGTYSREPDGTLLARRVVVVGPELPRADIRVAGEITQVNPGASTFGLHTRRGEDLVFTVTDATRFRSRDGSIESIHDLRPGMVAAVWAVREEDGDLAALLVAAGDREDLPGGHRVDLRVAGRITSVGSDSFTLEMLGGASKTFSVDGSTVFRSRGEEIDGIEDLEPGMRAVVGAQDLGDGGLTAVWVGVGLPRPEAEEPAD